MTDTTSLDTAAAALAALQTTIAAERTAVLAEILPPALNTDVMLGTSNALAITPLALEGALTNSGFAASPIGVALAAFIASSAGLPKSYSFDLAAPPSSPVLLMPEDRLTITFTGVSTIPMHVTAQPGVYKASLIATANNTTNSDWFWQPNDIDHSGAFTTWFTENADTGTTAAPFVAANAIAQAVTAQNAFYFDLFGGPITADTINDIGPSMHDFLISTATVAKMIKQTGGIAGGPVSNFAKWNDTSTPWTSLGTIRDSGGSAISGTLLIKRLK